MTSFLVKLIPIAAVHAMGNILTNVSLGKVAVSFTHTIKALEPFFSVILSGIFLGQWAPPIVLVTLIPIAAGVSLASFTEPSFNWIGLFAALGSNLFFQSRNVVSKLVMGGENKSIDAINFFSIMTIMSFLITIPISAIIEPGTIGLVTSGAVSNDVVTKALYAAFFFHAYQQLSYAILNRISPVTHSVGNCVKRVVVIASSIIFFQNPVSPLNLAGAGIAISGVYMYSMAKRLSAK
uniref:Sugar phosphate transporter domain-containing protein n=1 Tax=Bigelowiella natans TaxID=227086 RepID=A0A7S2P3P9_BIGNA|mmetsp:Transcript_1151/g.1774  ORF Transcript_1151/g.1774 Transcript_1151/m.1774 type:complete len:237 (+) Transcript_1151:99-809(+)